MGAIALANQGRGLRVRADDVALLAHKSQAQKFKELVRRLGKDARLKKLI